ncbi:LuxR C-terminal-related transcriptional regulator [Streptomyces avermitilis]
MTAIHSDPTIVLRDLDPTVVLRDLEKRIYARACEAGLVAAGDVETGTGASQSEIRAAIQNLRTLHLVRETEDGDGRFVAVSPESAKLQRLAPLLGELRRLQARTETMRTAYDGFVHVYETAAVERSRRAGIEVVPNRGDVRRTINGLAASSTTEVLTSHPGGPRPQEVLHESVARSRDLLERGVAIRTLYQHSAHFDAGTTAYVEHFTTLGTQFRTLADGFPQLMIFDRRHVLVPQRDPSDGATLVSDPSIVDFATAAFERAWVAATPFHIAYDQRKVRETSEDVRHSIMRLLVTGEEDRRIAARLGLSLRSCQRHVAQIMKRIGARNRLHAGYLISQHDLLNRPLPDSPQELAS